MDSRTKRMLTAIGLKEQVDQVSHGFCPFCKEPVSLSDFKDVVSRREYEISGICAPCQDKVFV